MASSDKPIPIVFCLVSLCSIATAEVHRLSCFHIISPNGAPGLPKHLKVMRVNDLVLAAHDSDVGRLAPRNGFTHTDPNFWSEGAGWYMTWFAWVETEYQILVQEVNASSPKTDPYFMQILKVSELDNVTGTIRAITRYAFNGEDLLWYQSDQNRWFSVHPAAWRVAERWNRAGETFGDMKLFMPQQCHFWIENSVPFTAQKTAQPAAHVALIPGTQTRPLHLICHVTGFYPHDINVTWERRGQAALGEQLSSGIWPNGDPTFQIQVSIELGQDGAGPAEHVCVVRHSSLGDTPLRVSWHSQPPGLAGVLWIVAACVLTAVGVGALGLFLCKRPGACKGPYRPAPTQPGTHDSASALAKSLGVSSSTTSCSDDTG